jgi:hypothetical protein
MRASELQYNLLAGIAMHVLARARPPLHDRSHAPAKAEVAARESALASSHQSMPTRKEMRKNFATRSLGQRWKCQRLTDLS